MTGRAKSSIIILQCTNNDSVIYRTSDVLVMATDGMWDVVTNNEVQRELKMAIADQKDEEKSAEIVHTRYERSIMY